MIKVAESVSAKKVTEVIVATSVCQAITAIPSVNRATVRG